MLCTYGYKTPRCIYNYKSVPQCMLNMTQSEPTVQLTECIQYKLFQTFTNSNVI